MAISSILRQISYSINTNFFACKLRFCKKKKELQNDGGGHWPHSPPGSAKCWFISSGFQHRRKHAVHRG